MPGDERDVCHPEALLNDAIGNLLDADSAGDRTRRIDRKGIVGAVAAGLVSKVGVGP